MSSATLRSLASVMFVRVALLVAMSVCAGCGLVLDVSPAAELDAAGEDAGPPVRDGGARDAGRGDGAAPEDAGLAADGAVDAGAACEVPRRETLPLEREPLGAPVPDFYDTGCTRISTMVEGGPGHRAEAALESDGGGASVIWLGAPVGGSVTLSLDFGSEVEDVAFVFEWLSLDEARRIEERLTLGVDGTPVMPTLERPDGVYLEGETVVATRADGRGRIRVERARQLKISVENLGPGDGLGIELREVEFTVRRASP